MFVHFRKYFVPDRGVTYLNMISDTGVRGWSPGVRVPPLGAGEGRWLAPAVRGLLAAAP